MENGWNAFEFENSFKAGKLGLGSSIQTYANINPFFYVTRVQMERLRRSQILSGTVSETDHFLTIFSDISYLQVPFEVWVKFDSQLSFKARSLI